jgi:arylsulfatase A-like enzyme
MLGEHEWWGKNKMPMFNEISKIPLMIYYPDYEGRGGERRQALTQTIDIMATILELYEVARPVEVEGNSLLPLIEKDGKIREAALYGIFGGATNITDGRYTYFRYPSDMANQEIYEYTLIPAHPTSFFEKKEFEGADLARSFNFTKGYPVMRLPSRNDSRRPPMQGGPMEDTKTVLYDLETDPGQNRPVIDSEIENRLIRLMIDLMKLNDAPVEAYLRLGFEVAKE